jgi:Na+-driven multidrug efflux pump
VGLATAAASLVGINLGNGNLARANETGWRCAGLGAASIVVTASIIFVFAPGLMRFFINDRQVIELGTSLIRVLAVVLPFHAAGLILARAMQGAGEAKIPFYITTFAWLIVRVPLAWVAAFPLGLESTGVWYSIAITQILAALLFGVAFYRGAVARVASLAA